MNEHHSELFFDLPDQLGVIDLLVKYRFAIFGWFPNLRRIRVVRLVDQRSIKRILNYFLFHKLVDHLAVHRPVLRRTLLLTQHDRLALLDQRLVAILSKRIKALQTLITSDLNRSLNFLLEEDILSFRYHSFTQRFARGTSLIFLPLTKSTI